MKKKKKKTKKNNNNKTGAEEKVFEKTVANGNNKTKQKNKKSNWFRNTRNYKCHRETMRISHCRIYTEIM